MELLALSGCRKVSDVETLILVDIGRLLLAWLQKMMSADLVDLFHGQVGRCCENEAT